MRAAAAAGEAYVGSLIGTGMKFGVVVGRFNDLVTKLLLEGALDTFNRHGVAREDVDVSAVLWNAVFLHVALRNLRMRHCTPALQQHSRVLPECRRPLLGCAGSLILLLKTALARTCALPRAGGLGAWLF